MRNFKLFHEFCFHFSLRIVRYDFSLIKTYSPLLKKKLTPLIKLSHHYTEKLLSFALMTRIKKQSNLIPFDFWRRWVPYTKKRDSIIFFYLYYKKIPQQKNFFPHFFFFRKFSSILLVISNFFPFSWNKNSKFYPSIL